MCRCGNIFGMGCCIKIGLFGRWYIFHATDDLLAWSGSRWVACSSAGFPLGNVQVCNFASLKEAAEYCEERGLRYR